MFSRFRLLERLLYRLGGAQLDLSRYKSLKDCPEVKVLLKLARPAIYLRPHRADSPMAFSESKMGGIPNCNALDTWPACPACGLPLLFVIQLYKRDFPELWFPEDANRSAGDHRTGTKVHR